MTVTLGDYARRQYPGHSTDVWLGHNPPLADHTVVVHVVGRDTAEQTLDLVGDLVTHHLGHRAPAEDVAAVLVLGSTPTMLPTSDEDANGVVDLPNQRIAAAAATGALLGLMVGIVVGMAFSLPAGGVAAICVFLAAAAGLVGAIAGGARLASERAVSQLQAPGDDIGVVAAMVPDEAVALALADDLTGAGLYDVRIVSSSGAWHAP